MKTKAQLLAERDQLADQAKALAGGETMTADQFKEFEGLETQIKNIDAQIICLEKARALSAATAQPVAGQDQYTVPAQPAVPLEKGIVVAGCAKMIGLGGGNIYNARTAAKDVYGENHPVTKALNASTGASGGFIVPPDQMLEIIELLRPIAQVRSAGPRAIPMPRGTMTLPGQNSAATASYGTETGRITASEQTLNSITASYKKLTALVPITNDLMRYSNPAVDAFVRDDLVKVLALREDLAFILGDGSASSPRGFLSFANGWVQRNGGTPGVYSTTANSTAAVNGTAPANSTGGNFVTSTAAYNLATVAVELGAAVNYLDSANVPDFKRVWFMHPRSYNYLFNVQNSLGVYVYRDELTRGTLLGYPVRKTTQIPTNYYNADGSYTNCSFVFLVEMTEAMILDSMTLELAVSADGTYVDSTGNTVSAFQNDQRLIRAIAEHDFQMRHDQAIAVIQFVRWAPASS